MLSCQGHSWRVQCIHLSACTLRSLSVVPERPLEAGSLPGRIRSFMQVCLAV